jgi:hypothetical protein
MYSKIVTGTNYKIVRGELNRETRSSLQRRYELYTNSLPTLHSETSVVKLCGSKCKSLSRASCSFTVLCQTDRRKCRLAAIAGGDHVPLTWIIEVVWFPIGVFVMFRFTLFRKSFTMGRNES